MYKKKRTKKNNPIVLQGEVDPQMLPAVEKATTPFTDSQESKSEQMKLRGLVNRFRFRARSLAVFAYFSVFGAIGVLLGGLYFFFYQSSDLALRDLKQRQEASKPATEAIATMADAYEAVDKAGASKVLVEEELHQTQKQLNGMPNELDPRYRLIGQQWEDFGWSQVRAVSGLSWEEFIEETRKPGYNWEALKQKHARQGYTFNGWTTPDIQEIIQVLSDDHPDHEASKWVRREYAKQVEELKDNRIPNATAEVEARQKLLAKAKDDNAGKGTLTELEEGLKNAKSSLDQKKKTVGEIENLLSDQIKFSAAAKEKIAQARTDAKNALAIATEAFEKRQKEDEVVQNKLKGLEASLKRSQREVVLAQATKDLIGASTAKSADGSHTDVTRNDVIFTITANLTRIGAIVVVVFFAQVFLAVYRFSMQLSGHYHARADALDLVLNSSTPSDKTLEALVIMIPALAPDLVDFKRPPSPTEDLTKLAAMLKDLKG